MPRRDLRIISPSECILGCFPFLLRKGPLHRQRFSTTKQCASVHIGVRGGFPRCHRHPSPPHGADCKGSQQPSVSMFLCIHARHLQYCSNLVHTVEHPSHASPFALAGLTLCGDYILPAGDVGLFPCTRRVGRMGSGTPHSYSLIWLHPTTLGGVGIMHFFVYISEILGSFMIFKFRTQPEKYQGGGLSPRISLSLSIGVRNRILKPQDALGALRRSGGALRTLPSSASPMTGKPFPLGSEGWRSRAGVI